MGLKTLLLYVVILMVSGGIGYAFIAGTNILSIRDLAIPTINLSTITQALGGVASTIHAFLAQYNINPITLMIGAIPAAISGIYALIRYRAEQRAKQAMMEAQQQAITATTANSQLQGTMKQQTETIQNLTTQLQSKANLEQQTAILQSALDAKTQETQQWITKYNDLQNFYNYNTVKCQSCGEVYPKQMTRCTGCGQPQYVP